MRHGLYVAPFGELAEPDEVVQVAVAAEAAGFDGLFLWDHMWRPPDRSTAVGDAWITLAAVACATSRLRIGPMVVPLARRRPQRVARESVALDRLSNGRLVLGVGLGVDTGGELERFGELTDPRARGDALDEALDLLLALWSGEPVAHQGARYTARDVAFQPTPVQLPRIPVWGAAVGGHGSHRRPLRRAARLDGLFPVGATLDEVSAMLGVIARLRGSTDGFEVAVQATAGTAASLESAGATWVVHALPEGVAASEAQRVARAGPT